MLDNTFQIILLSIFGLAALVGVIIFATHSGGAGGNSDQQPVSFSIWGEWEHSTFNSLLEQSGIADNEAITISYTSVPAGQLEERLINALARDRGPDVLLTPHTNLLQFSDLLTTISSDFYSQRKFRNNFVEGAEIFTNNSGIVALPIAVDPLVMYWNRDILTEAGVLSPPSYWEEMNRYVDLVTEFDSDDNIATAGISLGSANNVSFVKEILSSLLLQTNNPVVSQVPNGRYEPRLTGNRNSTESAVRLYTQFANPSSNAYTWNNSFTSAEQSFISGNLGIYLAPASHISQIRAANPNLNFDVSVIPQLQSGSNRTYGTFYGFSILGQAANKLAILRALEQLTNPAMAAAVTAQTNLAPVHKAALADGVSDAYKQVFYDSAVIARAWLEPRAAVGNQVFSELINNVNSGRYTPAGALSQAQNTLVNTLQEVNEN